MRPDKVSGNSNGPATGPFVIPRAVEGSRDNVVTRSLDTARRLLTSRGLGMTAGLFGDWASLGMPGLSEEGGNT